MREFRFSCELDAPPARVWEEFQPAQLSLWFQGRNHVRFELPPRVRFLSSGDFRLTMHNGKSFESLQVVTKTAPETISLQWSTMDGPDWQVLWTLSPSKEGKTKLVLIDREETSPLWDKMFFRAFTKSRYRASLAELKKRLAVGALR